MPSSSKLSQSETRKLIHAYYAATSYTDALIGEVVGELERLGLRDNTVIILWGDHGWKLGEYGAWCKHTNFELDTHVPMILSVPGQSSAGEKTPALVEFVDIYPTLAELCGLEVPAHCEGTSMLPLLADPQRRWKEAAFSQYPRRGGTMGYTMRCGAWRYTEWIDLSAGQPRFRELYDHRGDPLETVNQVSHADKQQILKRLCEKLHNRINPPQGRL